MDLLIQYAMRFVGTPYKWGGSNPITGFDCSGFIIELLRASGEVSIDMTAQVLFNCLIKNGDKGVLAPGAIVFYGASDKNIRHVGFMISNKLILEAGGGDAGTLTLENAIDKNAFIKMRPYNYRSDFVGSILPKYEGLK